MNYFTVVWRGVSDIGVNQTQTIELADVCLSTCLQIIMNILYQIYNPGGNCFSVDSGVLG